MISAALLVISYFGSNLASSIVTVIEPFEPFFLFTVPGGSGQADFQRSG